MPKASKPHSSTPNTTFNHDDELQPLNEVNLDDSLPHATVIPARRSHSRKQAADHIPRPKNAFILFRTSFVQSGKMPKSVEHDHRNISKIVGEMWRTMNAEEKQKWKDLAAQEKEAHRAKYPDYKYTPTNNRDTSPTPLSRSRAPKSLTPLFTSGPREIVLTPTYVTHNSNVAAKRKEQRCKNVATLLSKGRTGEELVKAMEEFSQAQADEIDPVLLAASATLTESSRPLTWMRSWSPTLGSLSHPPLHIEIWQPPPISPPVRCSSFSPVETPRAATESPPSDFSDSRCRPLSPSPSSSSLSYTSSRSTIAPQTPVDGIPHHQTRLLLPFRRSYSPPPAPHRGALPTVDAPLQLYALPQFPAAHANDHPLARPLARSGIAPFIYPHQQLFFDQDGSPVPNPFEFVNGWEKNFGLKFSPDTILPAMGPRDNHLSLPGTAVLPPLQLIAEQHTLRTMTSSQLPLPHPFSNASSTSFGYGKQPPFTTPYSHWSSTPAVFGGLNLTHSEMLESTDVDMERELDAYAKGMYDINTRDHTQFR